MWLTAETRSDLWQLAGRRNGSKQPEWTRRVSDVFNDHEVDFLGLVGEAAPSKVLGVPFDRSVHAHGDGGTDLVLPDQRIVATKFNHRQHGYLIFEERAGDVEREHLADFSADLAVLTVGGCDSRSCHCITAPEWRLWVVGSITRDRFLTEYRRADWGLGSRYYVPASALDPIEQLVRKP